VKQQCAAVRVAYRIDKDILLILIRLGACFRAFIVILDIINFDVLEASQVRVSRATTNFAPVLKTTIFDPLHHRGDVVVPIVVVAHIASVSNVSVVVIEPPAKELGTAFLAGMSSTTPVSGLMWSCGCMKVANPQSQTSECIHH